MQPEKQDQIVRLLLITAVTLAVLLIAGVVGYGFWLTSPGKSPAAAAPIRETSAPTAAASEAPSANAAQAAVETTLASSEPVKAPETVNAVPVTEETQPMQSVTATATLLAVGNILPASPILNAALTTENAYNFSPFLRYLGAYAKTADFATANLETTLSGTRSTGYTGSPKYNSPDALSQAWIDAGFLGLQTANNHAYDGDSSGFHRTVTTIRSQGGYPIGTKDNDKEPSYLIKDLNGIRIGLLAFTYETDDSYVETPSLNGILLTKENSVLVNSYHPDNTEAFIEKMKVLLSEMRQAGAELTVLYMHWGERYEMLPSDSQRNLAQKLCDLGVDVIIGTHSHVVQTPELLTNRMDASHRTLVFYSLGNAFSNQRRGLNKKLSTAHTEDGLMLRLTIRRYSDGDVRVAMAEGIPLWVNLKTAENPATYTVLPLEAATQSGWKSEFGLNSTALAEATASARRTNEIVSARLTEINAVLTPQEPATAPAA